MSEVQIDGLFETHLSVADRKLSARFYCELLGLELARDIPARDVTFLWIGKNRAAMLGLWGPQSPNPPISRGTHHYAFRCPVEQLLAAPPALNERGIAPLDFDGRPTEEPVVLAWIPCLSLYFKDPDGHSGELLAVLPHISEPELGVLPYSVWEQRRKR